MAWPAGGIDTTELSASDKSVAAARTALLAAVAGFNDIAASRGAANGIPSLDGAGQIPSAQLPAGIIPSGVLVPYAGATAPSGWLLCFGQAVSRTTYAALFAAIGTSWGVGDGSTTFNLPDMRGRVAAGQDNMGGTAAGRLNVTLTGNTSSGSAVITGLSSTTGLAVGMKAVGSTVPPGATVQSIDSASQVTLTSGVGVTAGTGVTLRFGVVDGATVGDSGGAAVHAMTTPQMPAHGHNYDAGGNSHYILRSTGGALGLTSGAVQANLATATQNAGGGQAHPNVQPTAVTTYIIKT